MRNLNIKKLLCALAFALLMLISSYMTVESLHRSHPEWPVWTFWAVTLIFFTLSSWGLNLLLESLDRNKRVEGRLPKMIGGLLLLVFFWIGFSFPTNTHTFFYKSEVKDILIKELVGVNDALGQISDQKFLKDHVQLVESKHKRAVEEAFSNYKNEVLRFKKPGDGPEAAKLWRKVELALGVDTLHRPPIQFAKNRKSLETYLNQRAEQVAIALVTKQRMLVSSFDRFKTKEVKRIKRLRRDLDSIKISLTHDPRRAMKEPTPNTLHLLQESHSTIERYNEMIKQGVKDLKKNGLGDGLDDSKNQIEIGNGVSEIQKLTHVVDTWKAYFQGAYKGKGFVYWIMLSLLIDIAGFFMFVFAFGKDEDEF